MTEAEFLSWVDRLDGYLSAVSHLNDHFGSRHFFFAFSFQADMDNLNQFLVNRFDDECIETHKVEKHRDSVRIFSEMVQQNIFINFLLGDSLHNLEKENFIKEQLKWHVEDYITMLETVSDKKPECWVVKHSPERETESMVFKFGDFAFVVAFSHHTKTAANDQVSK